MQLLQQTLGQLATELPGATRIFHQYRLDFCCQGDRTLATALAAKGLDAEAVVAQLENLQAEGYAGRDWRQASNQALVEHILTRYHERHREQLPELIRLARRVEHVHGDLPAAPVGLAEHLSNMYQELESHMMKEEQILFPMLVQNNYPGGPISVMEEEHVQHGKELEVIDQLTNNVTLPQGACNTWTALYTLLREFRQDIMDHIHLENHVLFKSDQAA